MSSGDARGRGENLRRAIMAAAIDCFARHGYQGTSIDRIAQASGVTKGALYYYFRDKEDLLFEAVKDRIAQFERHVAESVGSLTDPALAFREIARVCVRIATKDNLRRFIITLMIEALDTYPALSQEFRGIMRRFRRFLADLVRRGQESGEFAAGIDPQIAAQLFAAGVVGIEIQHYQDPTRVAIQAASEGFVEQFLGWLRAAKEGPDACGGRIASKRGVVDGRF